MITQLPEDFQLKMRAKCGANFAKFLEALSTPSPTSIRLNPSKSFREDNLESVAWCATGKYLDARPVFTLDPRFHSGAYYVQEASSMFLEQAILQTTEPGKAINVLDLCAAPGGKSTHLLSLLNKQSLLVSNEVIQSRTSVLAENIQKWGANNVVVTNNDPHDFNRVPGFFDIIVVDAPCSGEGLFRKDPEAMKEWSLDNVALCSKRQRRILSDVWPALKQGGFLIYSTCTYNESENEEILSWLQQEQPVEFVKLKINPDWNIEIIEQADAVGYRFFPHLVKGEGFFLSLMRKPNGETDKRMKSRVSFSAPPKKITDRLSDWVLNPQEKTFINRDGLIQFFPKSKSTEIEYLAQNLHLSLAGTFLASVKHDKLVPEHAAALSIELNKENFYQLDVSLDEALQYLRKETLNLNVDKRGYGLVCCQGNPLGWINMLENRLNNLYPSNWRIRMQS